MTDIAQLHRQALDTTRGTVAGIRDDQLEARVNEGWDVRGCLNHVVAGNWWAEALAGGATIDEVGDRLDGDVLGEDLLKAYDTSAEAAAAAFEAEGALAAPCAVSYGPVPGEVYAGHRFIDVLIHGWDLASATGQDATLPPGLVEACFAVVEPQIEGLQASGQFGEAPEVPEGASRQTQLLALMGRRG